MVNLENIGVPQVANRAFVPLAIEAGIVVTIRSLVGLAMDKITLLIALKEALQNDNQPLADALNIQTLDAILNFTDSIENTPILNVSDLPLVLSDVDPPVNLFAGRDGGAPSQVNLTFTTPPENFGTEIYLDGVFYAFTEARSQNANTDTFISDIVPGTHTIRVLYRRIEDNAITLFSPIVTIQ